MTTSRLLRPLRLLVAAGLAVTPLTAVAAIDPPSAAAATAGVTSTNWGGYAVRRTGTSFTRVSGAWTVPEVTCEPGTAAASANWVGLGGYNTTSSALEQLGTESDCSASGHASYSAWFEVVPAPSSSSRLVVRAGDAMRASAAVRGHEVTLRLANLTRGTSATRHITAAHVDTSSAEWIVEAPSLCLASAGSTGGCRTTTLADVGTTSFTAARTQTSGGHGGTISDPAWSSVAITLREASGRGFGRPYRESALSAGGAAPGSLDATGGAFSVVYGGSGAAAQDGAQPTVQTPPTTAGVRR